MMKKHSEGYEQEGDTEGIENTGQYEGGIDEESSGKTKRKAVAPGEIIVSGSDFLPGDWTRRDGNDILASRFGLAEVSGRLVRVIPISGVYIPRRGNIVIGRVTDITFNGWLVDINAPYSAFLSVSEFPRYINSGELEEYIGIKDMIACKIYTLKRKSIDLTVKSRGLGKITGGMLINVNPSKVPRVIGKEGSMINLIKQETGCEIIVGQNGIISIKGDKVEKELLARDAIEFISDKATTEGLTEKVKTWFEEKK